MSDQFHPKKVVVDFDGTLCGFAFPDIGPPEPNVKEGLQKLRDSGYYIVIHSVRTATYWKWGERHPYEREKHIKIIIDFMENNNLPYDEVLLDTNCDKPVADVYIDDRAVAYRGDWLQAADEAIKLLKI